VFLLFIPIISEIAGYVKYNKYMDEAVLYILYSPVHKAVKIGISDITGRRFKAHRTKGWVLVSYWHFFERDRARAIESLVIQTLRKKHKPFLTKEDMPQGGYTETFDASKITRRGLIRMVNKAIKDYTLEV
jgi:predicted GIY-YIG superfamily endonuclease